MIKLTRSRQIAYGLFAQTVILLVLYSAFAMLSAIKFLPDDPLINAITYAQASGYANLLLDTAIITGLLGGGIYVVATERQMQTLSNENLLNITYRLWTLLAALVIFFGLIGQLEGRHMLELLPFFDIARLILVSLFLGVILASPNSQTAFTFVWASGLILSALCTLAGLIPPNDFVQDRVFRVIAVNINLNAAYVLAGLALAFWLMTRFSNVMQAWADTGLYNLAGLLAIGGVLVSLAPLYPAGASSFLGNIAAIIVPIFYLMLAAHSYRALSDRNPTVTLAAHWTALGVLLLLVGVGILGALQAAPGIQQMTQGTRLTDLQVTLTSFGIIALILGTINQAAAELRARNQRVTGLMPFWMVAFGVIGGGIALFGAGIVQVYLERMLSVGYLDTQTLMIPLYILWIIGVMLMASGIAIYALGFRARRPATLPLDE